MATKRKTGKKPWVGRVRVQGQTPKSKSFHTKREALEWEALQREEMENWGQIGTVSFLGLVNTYLDDIKLRVGHDHYTDVMRVLTHATEEFSPATPVKDINKAMVSTWLRGVAQKSRKRANRYRVYIVSMYNWAIEEMGFPAPNPWMVKKYKAEQPLRRVYTVDEFHALTEVANEHDKVMLAMLLSTGGRRWEVLSLEWKAVDLKSGTVTLTTDKRRHGTEHDTLAMEEDLLNMLKAHKARTFFSGKVFLYKGKPFKPHDGYTVLKSLCRASGVEYKGFHAFRRLAACVSTETVGIDEAQRVLRHSKMSTTDVYVGDLVAKKRKAKILEFARKAG